MNSAVLMLAVATGSILHLPAQQPIVLREVPEDAVTHWENGAHWLMLKKDSAEALAAYSKTKLEELLKNRSAVGYAREIEQIEKALKAKSKEKPQKPDTVPTES